MKALYNFFHSEAAGGIVMMIAAALAMLIANSPLEGWYHAYLAQTLTVGFTSPEGAATVAFQKPLLLWINDFFMAIFFLYAGMEIKREMFRGALSSAKRAMLPIISAACGMAVPAAIYLFINQAHPEFHHGWAIPSATDIAFAVGVIALASSRVPSAIKILLLAIAVVDDLGAMLVIALFYNSDIYYPALAVAGVSAAILFAFNRLKITAYGPYFIIGFILWAALFQAGVHPTIAGVILGFSIPMIDGEKGVCPLENLEHMIQPWVTFCILPIFAFANAGVSFAGLGFDALLHPVTLGIGAGLFIGKQIGIFGSVWLCVKAGICHMPTRASWLQVYGMAVLCGIGFTMALFVGGLAFEGHGMDANVRLGVMAGSVLSALAGYGILCIAAPRSYEEAKS
ncbi:MAG: Na+/H+ antiporter NhaA [Alphaproteobacteria bacterium]|nr:Na+/H+ antiporter NhaA [Alphaproteobacteria bacterium]